MAFVSDTRQTVLAIVNEVQRLVGVDTTTTLTATKDTRLYLRFLNETVAECADAGNWLELYSTVLVTAQSSVSEYTVNASDPVHHIYEIRWGTDTAPLEHRSIEYMRRLLAQPSHGTPRQFALTGVNSTSNQPKFSVYQIPTTAQTFDVAFYKKPELYDTNCTEEEPPFPANVLIKGTHAKALLDENGGEPTNQWEVTYREYLDLRNQALNRWTADTGTDIYFVPQRGPRRGT